MLRNKRFLGDGYYPPIIDAVTFDKAEEIRTARAAALGRTKKLKNPPRPKAAASFVMPKVECKFTDPFKQAEYVYSKIEEEKDE